MKSSNSELTQRYLVLIKTDAFNLFQRIQKRQDEYIGDFSLKRDREIFKSIFKCRYESSTMFDLSHLPIEIIEVANDYYTKVDELHWYLMNTQDMPTAIADEVTRCTHLIEKKYEVIALYIDAELSGSNNETMSEVNQ